MITLRKKIKKKKKKVDSTLGNYAEVGIEVTNRPHLDKAPRLERRSRAQGREPANTRAHGDIIENQEKRPRNQYSGKITLSLCDKAIKETI